MDFCVSYFVKQWRHPLGHPHSRSECLGLSLALLPVQLLASVYLEKQLIVAYIVGLLPFMWEALMEIWAPVFGIAELWLLYGFGEWRKVVRNLLVLPFFFSRSLLSNKQRKPILKTFISPSPMHSLKALFSFTGHYLIVSGI